MSKSPKPRLHHYFPQFQLTYFADSAAKLWAFDKRERLNPNPKQVPVAAIAAEAYLYDDDAPEEGVEGVEEWLASAVDGPASIALRRVIERKNITPDQRAAIGRYVLARDLRTPATRDTIMTQAQAGVEADYDRRVSDIAAIRRAILEDSGVDIAEDDIRALSKAYRPVVTKGFWLEFLQRHTVKALPRLLANGWTLFHAESDCEFITSDVGLLKHAGAWDRPVVPSPGWSKNAEGWLLPITPRLMLAMAPGLDPREKIAQRAYVDPLNKAMAIQAREFVFAGSEYELHRALATV